MILPLRPFDRPKALPAVFLLLAALLCPAASHADDKDKKKPEKEKKEKIEPWFEVRTPHFVVASDGGEKTARRFADEFESLLHIFQSTMPKSRVSTGIPVRILVARNGESFARVAPEFPYNKNRDQPAGLFLAGPERTYLAIRANASGRFAFADIFQNYAKEILKHSYRSLPPWLEEGYSTVFASLTFRDSGPRLERPDPDDLSVLFESPLLPLDLVLNVDRTSGYYSPGNKGSVYFAESRVLLHYLITDPQFAAGNQMDRYITAVQSGADPLKSARDAFGDLNQLQSELDAYIKNVSGPPVDMPGSGNESSGPARMLSPAEAEARLAGYQALGRRSEDAEDKLNEALMTDPSLAEAEQSLGFLLLKRDDLDEAQKHFERAAQLDPPDALNYYGLGMVALGNAGKTGISPAAAVPFEKSVSLNSDFAPSWYRLALIYSQRDDTLPKALTAAQKAAALEPGDGSYQLQVASLLNQLGHPDEAKATAAHVKETSADRSVADKAGDLVARISRSQPSSALASTGAAPSKAPSDSAPRTERKTAAAAPASSTASAPKPQPAPAPVPPLFSGSTIGSSSVPAVASTQIYSMFGTITDVNCAISPQVQITLKSQTITMKLHADNLDKLSIRTAGAAGPLKSTACASLRGRNARVSYLLVSQKAWDGEMQAVEFRGEP